jgi:hypothetical protein
MGGAAGSLAVSAGILAAAGSGMLTPYEKKLSAANTQLAAQGFINMGGKSGFGWNAVNIGEETWNKLAESGHKIAQATNDWMSDSFQDQIIKDAETGVTYYKKLLNDAGTLVYEYYRTYTEQELFKAGVSNAYKVAVGINFLTSETIIPLVQKAARSAIGVALELPIFIPDLLTTYISRAACNAAVVESTVFGVSEAQAAPAKSDDKSKKDSKKIEKKDSDDDVMGAGIGSLFG